MKHFTCAILTASTILTGSFSSVLADTSVSTGPDSNSGDAGVVQTNMQTTVFTGDKNESNQMNRQENNMERGNRTPGDDVVVQENDQYCDALGHSNRCNQDSDQRSRINRR